jgi:hypothetical protein
VTTLLNRRELITGGLKAGVSLVFLDQVSGIVRPVWSASKTYEPADERFKTAYKRLDEFIARHMNETGAPVRARVLVSFGFCQQSTHLIR